MNNGKRFRARETYKILKINEFTETFELADPVAALIMVPIIANEGIVALRGETCDDCHCE